MIIYVLFYQVSKQFNTYDVVGVYSSEGKALEAAIEYRRYRIFIKEMVLDAPSR